MKIKKTMKSHITAAMILSATFLFIGCGTNTPDEAAPNTTENEISENENDMIENDINGKNQNITSENDVPEENQDLTNGNDIPEENQDISNENNIPNNQLTPAENTNIYDDILAQYRNMVQNDFYADLRESDAYESSFGKDIGLEIRTHEQAVFYAFYDIDGNGTMELVIAGGENDVGVSNPTFSPWNYDLYGYDGTNVVHIFPEMEFGYRTNFSLYDNGVIEVFYSSSAAESGVDFYKIGADGFTPELIDSFTAVAHLEGDEAVFVYSQNGNEITEEEYNANIQGYEIALTDLDWIQIQ